MTEKQFYDWQTVGGTDDVMRFVNALEKDDIRWCTIGGVAVNHWAAEQMVTLYVDFAVAADSTEKAEKALRDAGFTSEQFDWSINFKGASKVSIQLTTEDSYREFAERGVAADVHGILMRVASLEDTLTGKIRAYSDPKRRQSKRLKDLADIAGLSNLIRSYGSSCLRSFNPRSTVPCPSNFLMAWKLQNESRRRS